MANNRMFLVNRKSGAQILLAKYYPSTGWFSSDDLHERLNEAFHHHDLGHLSPLEEMKNAQVEGLGVPHQSIGGALGDTDWYIDYEERGDG